MHYFVFSEKDATIYQASGSMNTGLDEILEVRKDISPTGDTVNVSRTLIEFDLTRITREINVLGPTLYKRTTKLSSLMK